MNRLKIAGISTALLLVIGGCASYTAQQRAHQAAQTKNWDEAVVQYTKAVELNPSSLRYKIDLQHAKLEASRNHFEKGKSLETAAFTERGPNQYRLAQLAATELELTVKLDPTNQWAAVELGKIVQLMQDYNRSADKNSIEEIKKRASGAKAQPPVLNPASDQPISLSFPRETPVKDIYRALGNAFGINILFDQAVKNDSIAIELKDVTAQQALERVMQAANHFYKVLDEHTIIVIPDNPQARRDYEDLVIRTFYLSNGDAEQVTNVVRTMLEARNVFPLKALNAITIRDTADKVRIAEKIIEANDKAKAEVVVDVELLQLDEDHIRDIGAFISNTGPDFALSPVVPTTTAKDSAGNTTTVNSPVTISTLRQLNSKTFTFNIPTVTYSFLKSLGETQTLANPELRISEGEKATLHIGSRVPVPISTFNSLAAGTTAVGAVSPVTSFQYQDIGIKVGIEPRVHHNREVTLKLTVEVSDLGPDKTVAGQSLPTFVTRTIEDTIRLKDGETNFLAGLIQESNQNHDDKTPFLGDIPFLGRLFTENKAATHRTDLMLTMTPHIVRIPDITEEDAAPMWVGTQNNLTFRGVSPRIESRTSGDPFAVQTNVNGRDSSTGLPLAPDGEPGNIMQPPSGLQPVTPAPNGPRGTGRARPNESGPEGANQLQPRSPVAPATTTVAAEVAPVTNTAVAGLSAAATAIGPAIAPPLMSDANIAAGFTPRIAPQPFTMSFKPGIEQEWTVVGMDLDGLTTNQIVMHFDPQALNVADVTVGGAFKVDPKKPPVVNIDNSAGTIRISTSDGLPLAFNSGGDVAQLRARGGLTGSTFLVIDNPSLKNGRGEAVAATVSGGHVNVE